MFSECLEHSIRPYEAAKKKNQYRFRPAFMSPTANARIWVHGVGSGPLPGAMRTVKFLVTLASLRGSCSPLRTLGINLGGATRLMNPLNVCLMFLARRDRTCPLKFRAKNYKI